MKQLFHIIIISLVILLGSCQKEQFKGSGNYKKNKEQKKNDNYLESEAGKVVEKNKKRNKKAEKKKMKEHKEAQEDEIDKVQESKKKSKKKKNTGRFHFY